jgi:integrating conjugative element protein (TIGR03757 family)
MWFHYLFPLSLLMLVSPFTGAQTVIYITAAHTVTTPEPGVQVFQLDDVSRLEASLFPRLPDNPAEAEQQARRIMQQPDWKTREAQLTSAYQALTDAWTLGITKTPAVVFDDRYVVYGTTDTALAQKLLDKWREKQP